MKSFIIHTYLSTLIGCLLIVSCAQIQQYTQKPVTSAYQLSGLPRNVVDVEVSDLRPDTPKSDALKDVLKGQLLSALSAQPSLLTDKDYQLSVDVIEHRSFFTLGNWNASTRFRVKLLDSKGTLVGQWDALGTAHRSNMWGYATAEAVSQDSYNIAVADMMSSLAQVSVRE